MTTIPIRVYLPTDRVSDGLLTIADNGMISIEFPESVHGRLRLEQLIESGQLVGIMFSYLIAVPKKE